jgi:hypothetical protein
LGLTVGGWNTPSQKTEAWVLADATAIYFAVRCWEAHPEQIRAELKETKDRDTIDTVEFFLDPGHLEARYYHVLVTPQGGVHATRFAGRDALPETWKARIKATTGRFPGGWTVEVAMAMQDLHHDGTAIPRVWGLNITRQRPELGVVRPQAATGKARFHPQVRPLDEPEKYREGELSAWAPTWSDGNYPDSRPFHFPKRFGHALLEAGNYDVPAPARLFELLFKSDFDRGAVAAFHNGELRDESFRGPGKSYASMAEGKQTLYFLRSLEDLEDVTLIMTLKMAVNGRLYYYGRAPDNAQCGADRHEIFVTREEVAGNIKDRRPRSLLPPLELYDTHADKMAWKPWGRLWNAPGSWAMMTGYFSEPTGGSVMYPGRDWVILRTRLGLFRRYPGSRPGQSLVPLTQNYPQGLVFSPDPGPLLIGDLVIFRGIDAEPPARVTGVRLQREGEALVVLWDRAHDNTLTAYYGVFAGQRLVAQTHRLSIRIPAGDVDAGSLGIVAYDLYGNASVASEPVRASRP